MRSWKTAALLLVPLAILATFRVTGSHAQDYSKENRANKVITHTYTVGAVGPDETVTRTRDGSLSLLRYSLADNSVGASSLQSTQDLLSLLEEQAGDPGRPREKLVLDDATTRNIQEFLSRPSRGPKVDRPRLALETLRIAKTHIGNSRMPPATRVTQYLALYGLPFALGGKPVPFCASGIGFASCEAYRQLTNQSSNLNDPNTPLIFRDSLTDVQRDFGKTHPACRVMVEAARNTGTWQNPTNPDGSRVIPKPGWLIFYNWGRRVSPNSKAEHVGIVDEGSTAREVRTVEFNTSDSNFSNGGAVLARRRPYSNVVGYTDTYRTPTGP